MVSTAGSTDVTSEAATEQGGGVTAPAAPAADGEQSSPTAGQQPEEVDLCFGEIADLWKQVKDTFGPDTCTDESLREILTDLQSLSFTLLNSVDGGGTETFDALRVLGPDSRAAATLQKSAAQPFFEAMGYVHRAGSWHLENMRKPMVRATNHFVEVKLGVNIEPQEELPTMGLMQPQEPSAAAAELVNPDVPLDLDALIQQVRFQFKLPDEKQLKTICHRARDLFCKEENILSVEPPCTIVGDIHGQFWDLVFQILEKGGDPGETRYVFLGDFVDRGEHSLLCMCLILLYKLKYPDRVVLLRGNHESRITNTIYGFHEECRQQYPSALSSQSSLNTGRLDSQIWTLFNHMFDALPLAALVGRRIFCCHGGLSPHLPFLERLLTFSRFQDIMPQGPMADLTWSDPGASLGWRLNVRGSGHMFGQDVTQDFCTDNGLLYVCRAHQCVKAGYKWDQRNRIVTVFSAPNYCWASNKGAIMKLDEDLKESFLTYDQAERPDISLPPPDAVPEYFQEGAAQPAEGEAAAPAPAPAPAATTDPAAAPADTTPPAPPAAAPDGTTASPPG